MRRWRCWPVRVGIEHKQLYTYHFIEEGMFLQYVFKQSALCLIACFDIVAVTIGQHGRATGPPRPIHCCCCPQRKNTRGVKIRRYVFLRQSEGWRHKSLYHLHTLIDGQLVPVRGACTFIHAHNSGTTCLRVHVPSQKWSSLHGLSSLSFCRWGSVTPCIYRLQVRACQLVEKTV